jgi:hypothetical protein
MNAYLLLALELHKARHNDLLREAEKYRLGRAAAALWRAQKKRARRPAEPRLAA